MCCVLRLPTHGGTGTCWQAGRLISFLDSFAAALQGILNAQGCQTVARLCFYVFTPALTFSKLAQAVNPQSIAHLWPLLANMSVRCRFGGLP